MLTVSNHTSQTKLIQDLWHPTNCVAAFREKLCEIIFSNSKAGFRKGMKWNGSALKSTKMLYIELCSPCFSGYS